MLILLITFIGLEVINCAVLSERDPRNSYKQYNGNQVDTKAKRPFCNAFTGCGRKRSNEVVPPVPVQSFEDDDGISDLLELNSEPAIENLMRQIMSEAKMYEAIQEANREMFLQKLKHANNANRTPSAYSLQ
ncbi:hypothetical protein PVAND_005383 [Polypedilum vanderplanki]|uniref:Cardioactive peptide n=1 Tax=Polypedilum vanderplanki TaxID=319348 RepID=A0A9J6C0E8_POLVA|nr:hypothetical protein PVAND_005383 [Polypedilum vanderplanki]